MVRDHHGMVERRFRQQHRELFAPHARQCVLFPQHTVQGAVEGDQGLVADIVPKGVVDPFEMVDIQHQHRTVALIPLHPFELGLHLGS